MTIDVPGYEKAASLGYTLFAFGADHRSATYSKGKLILRIWADNRAEVSSVIGLVILSAGEIGWPNENFHIFEKQVQDILDAWEAYQ